MKKYFLLLSVIVFPLFGQVTDTTLAYEYPYVLPIFGQKVADRGIKMQKPLGINVNYVNNQMDLEISEFGMSLGDDPSSDVNQLIGEYVNLNTLNFQTTKAITNGVNVRLDFWLLPFMNVYGLYSNSSGSTEVSLSPSWHDEDGNLILALPQFGSTVLFDANSYGFGTTLVYGYKNYFVSADVNYTLSTSELLTEPAKFLVASARIGERFTIKDDTKISLYVGAMRRGFVETDGNFGQVTFEQVFPDIGSTVLPAIDDKISSNITKIESLDASSPTDAYLIAKMEAQNEILYNVEDSFEKAINTDINYNIKKDIVNNWSVQFGFNLEINESWMFRGEFGKGSGNSFVMTGLQYRFGL